MRLLDRPTPDVQGTLNEIYKWVKAPPVSWTPVLTFATAGDLNVVYSAQIGRYVLLGPLVLYWFNISTSTFTHSTASGNCQITGLSHPSLNVTGFQNMGSLRWQGITKANYTDVSPRVGNNTTIIELSVSGSGQAADVIDTADMPTGGSVVLRGFGVYIRA